MFVTRQKLEEIESQTLATYATLSKNTRGRFHHDNEPRYRTVFQRDRDRIIHAEAFRKLEYKTQVFVNDEGDYYRTRLTHTLEVAQIGRTIACAIGVNETLAEAICLAHDLGHPPFGHAGEHILNQMMSEYGGFNHNHQSYRVVTELERRYPQWNGLNLSYETLEGIAKHETEYDVSEAVGFDIDKRGSLEAQIADVADELAYNAHDLDDGLQSGLITPDQLADLTLWQQVTDKIGWQGGRLSNLDRHRAIRELVGLQVDDVVTNTVKNLTQANVQKPEDAQNHTSNLVAHSPEQRQRNRQLKDFLYENMYRHFRVVRMQERAEHFIQRLFKSYTQKPRQLPPEYFQQIEANGRHRVVADYIAGMTDRSALLEYRRLFDPTVRP